MISDRTRSIIIYVVLTVWAVNFFAPFLVHSYKPDGTINGIFMAIVGGALVIRPKKPEELDDSNDATDAE